MDSDAQDRIIKEVTNSVLERFESNLSELTNELREKIALIGEQYNSLLANLGTLPTAPAKEKKVKVEAKPAPAVKEKKSSESVEEKLNKDIQGFSAYKKYPDFIDEMGFKSLLDMLVYQATHQSPQYFQEQTFITDFLNESKLKVFVNKPEVKKRLKTILKQTETPKKAKKAEAAPLPSDGVVTKNTPFESLDASKILKGFVRKKDLETVKDAVMYCNEVKLKALLKEGAVNKHSMDYQLVKYLSGLGFSNTQMEAFLKKVDSGATGETEEKLPAAKAVKSKASEEDAYLEKEMKSSNFHNLTEEEFNTLYSDVKDYPFSEYLQETVFKKYKIKSIFELLFWVCGITRDFLAYKLDVDKAALIRFENILEEHGIIEPISKMEAMSYTYKSKYFHYVRFYRNKIINRQLSLIRFNKNLTEDEQNALYTPVEELGFSEETLAILKHNKITTAIGLISYINYGCDTAYPAQFTDAVLEEIDKVLYNNDLKSHKFVSYVNGLRSYYYKSSMFIQKRKAAKQQPQTE
ncbi:MAG: hypothetical protein LBR64_04395 [Dysgonamonadaceae bacterium]|jgi:hypothetical protein|nr:hypothetical protein [Dysgonamonadaceae bacterium]